MHGIFISFEGTEGSGKTTQIRLFAERLSKLGRPVRLVREPGGTAIGEEIRHTLQHSADNRAMTPEAELLLINASRAQLVREIIRPALERGEIVVCDRFYDSTTAYQGYGRSLDLSTVQRVIEVAVGGTRPDLTLLLFVPVETSEARRLQRTGPSTVRDRMEEADRDFFLRVEVGYRAIAKAEPGRVKLIDATQEIPVVAEAVWKAAEVVLGSSVPGTRLG
jgi:dTMP kinase